MTTSPNRKTLDVGDKLVTYLDCESVQFDTAYVDAGAPHSRSKGTKKERDKTAERMTYVKGSDFMTGTRIVVEREGDKKRAGSKCAT